MSQTWKAVIVSNDGKYLIAKGVRAEAIYISTDYGVTWTLETDMEFDMIIQWFNAQ